MFFNVDITEWHKERHGDKKIETEKQTQTEWRRRLEQMKETERKIGCYIDRDTGGDLNGDKIKMDRQQTIRRRYTKCIWKEIEQKEIVRDTGTG